MLSMVVTAGAGAGDQEDVKGLGWARLASTKPSPPPPMRPFWLKHSPLVHSRYIYQHQRYAREIVAQKGEPAEETA